MRLTDVLELLPEEGGPDLLVMELAHGTRAHGRRDRALGQIVLGHAKTRESMRAGLAMYFESLNDHWLLEVAQRIVGELGIDYFFNIQLVGDYVIEINPRISTVVYQEDLNLPYLGVKIALGEISREELAQIGARVRTSRRALRYFDQVEWDESSPADTRCRRAPGCRRAASSRGGPSRPSVTGSKRSGCQRIAKAPPFAAAQSSKRVSCGSARFADRPR